MSNSEFGLLLDLNGAPQDVMTRKPASVVAIVGGGFSGSLTALHLLEQADNIQILLIERAAAFGRGLAYSTSDPTHLLNVRVGNMSAWPDWPGHLEQWLSLNRAADAGPTAFISRATYGRYLTAMLKRAVADSHGAARLVLVHDEAVALAREGDRMRLTLAMGHTQLVDAVIIASGNPPPAPPGVRGLETLPESLYAPDPWAPGALEGLGDTAQVALIGTGLTMIDVALALRPRKAATSVFAISRRGLSPREHEGGFQMAGTVETFPTAPLSALLSRVRAHAACVGWRAAVDALRPITQQLWADASVGERRRFLRHLRPWWDVHRHRMAPLVGDRIAEMVGSGGLTVAAGSIVGVERAGERARILWRPRGKAEAVVQYADRVINCTGPGGDPTRSGNPFLRHLIAAGWARADPLHLGLDVDGEARVIDLHGTANPHIRAVGPVTKGAFWEIVAVPDIRNQVATVAASLVRQLKLQRTP